MSDAYSSGVNAHGNETGPSSAYATAPAIGASAASSSPYYVPSGPGSSSDTSAASYTADHTPLKLDESTPVKKKPVLSAMFAPMARSYNWNGMFQERFELLLAELSANVRSVVALIS